MRPFWIVIGTLAAVFWLMTFIRIEGCGKLCWSGIGLLAMVASLAATAPG